jgi:23S rRNA (guanosine2251-2'-O)-methyltransferase
MLAGAQFFVKCRADFFMKKERKAVIFGINPVREKLRTAPREIHEILLASNSSHPVLRSLVLQARQRGIKVRILESAVLSRVSGTLKHQGIVAEVDEYLYYPFDELLRDISLAQDTSSLLALDGITDPRNLGAVLRTAEGAGLKHVVIPTDRAAGLGALVAKSSAGADNYLKISRVTNLRRALITFKEHGFWVVGLDSNAGQPMYELAYPEKLVVVLGSEGTGMRPLIKRECDLIVTVPMLGDIGSLNVSVAAGIFLYELVRRKLAR